MNHLMRYEGFSPQERQDEILDKINKYGISSLNMDEKEFLDSYSNNKEDEIHKKLQFHENETIFEDDQGYFKFELQSIKDDHNGTIRYIGIMYVPDIEFGNGKKIEGRLEGSIIGSINGRTSLDFHSKGKSKYDIFEFCNGLEYELDSFVDYVVMELEKNNSEI